MARNYRKRDFKSINEATSQPCRRDSQWLIPSCPGGRKVILTLWITGLNSALTNCSPALVKCLWYNLGLWPSRIFKVLSRTRGHCPCMWFRCARPPATGNRASILVCVSHSGLSEDKAPENNLTPGIIIFYNYIYLYIMWNYLLTSLYKILYYIKSNWHQTVSWHIKQMGKTIS